MRFSYHPLNPVMIAVAVWLSLVPLDALVDPGAYALHTLPLLVASAAVGLTLALLRAPRAVTLFAQLVAVLGVALWRGLALAGPGDAVTSLMALTRDGMEIVRSQPPPLSPAPGMTWLLLVLTAILLIVLELLVDGLEQPGWAIAPLSLVFVMTALIVHTDLPVTDLIPVIGGYLLVLHSASGPGAVTGKASRRGPFHASRAGTAVALTSVALIASLLVSPLIPLGTKQPWNSGQDGPIQLSDPTVRLTEDLRRPADQPVLTYRTNDDGPVYLRTVALSSLTSNGARLVPMRLSRFGIGNAYDFPGTRISVGVQMADMASEYLPAPFAVQGFDAEGTWSYDPDTLTIVAAGPDRIEQTRNLAYTVEAVQPDPKREEIMVARAGGGLDPVLSEIPDGLSPEVAALTEEIVSDTDTAGEAALAIQAFLRSEAFTYSLAAPSASGSDAISAFLLDDRSGYCIHFAAAMITMARLQGIPARMAIGFAPGERRDDGTYEVSTHDAHSWPELYFEDLGWVPFEPTPAYAGDPDNTDPAAQPSTEPTSEPSGTPSATGSAQPTLAPPTPTALPTEEPGGPSSDSGGAGLALGIGLLALLLLLVTPALVRLAQRLLRLRPGQADSARADAAWAEVRSTIRDHGLPWSDGSPGPVARSLAPDLPQQGAAALLAIARTVELSRFARDGAATEGLPSLVRSLRTSLSRAAGPGRRLRAVLLPASLLPSARRRKGSDPRD